MAKKAAKKEAPAKTGKAKGKEKESAKDADKAAKKAARMEALKNRPEGQRPNSKQVDIIELPDGGKIVTYGYAVRKTGTLVTTVAYNSKGEVVSTSTTLVPGCKVKTKKGHGNIVPGLAGVGKKKDEENEEEDED